MKERGKGAEEFCAIATMSDTDRHRQTQREIALGSTPTHRETNKTTTQSTPSHGGPREGEKGTWDQCTTDTIGGGLGFSYLFFSFFFWCVACAPPPPFLPSFIPSFLSSPKKNNCFAPVSALQMASGAYLFQHNLQLRGRKSNTY